MNQNVRFRKALAFAEVLKRFERSEEAKAYKEKKLVESADPNIKGGDPPKKNHNCEDRQNER